LFFFKKVTSTQEEMNPTEKEPNRGTGAGGKNTNHYGKAFEHFTCHQERLLGSGFVKSSFKSCPKKVSDFYFTKTYEDKTIVFVSQQGLKEYMKCKYNIQMLRNPDEAYIVEYKDGRKILKILEKKEQRVDGSVEEKLLTPGYLKREYEIVIGKEFVIQYALTVSEFLKHKFLTHAKFKIWKQIYEEDGVPLFFGTDENYFDQLDAWIHAS